MESYIVEYQYITKYLHLCKTGYKSVFGETLEDAYKMFNNCIKKDKKINNNISYQMIYQNLFDVNFYKRVQYKYLDIAEEKIYGKS